MTIKPTAMKFSVFDLMILIASMALGFGWVKALNGVQDRAIFDLFYLKNILISQKGIEEGNFIKIVSMYFRFIARWIPCLATITVAMTFLNLKTRGARNFAWKQAGFCACLGASVVILIEVVRACLQTFRKVALRDWNLTGVQPGDPFLWSDSLIPTVSASEVALGIAAAWAVLLVSGRWRFGSSWQARFQLLIGLAWLGMGSFQEFLK